jgi:histidinol-phosphate phosphatase family protein
MKEHKMSLNLCHINKDWTLFLDRDGVINKRRVDDYVTSAEEFVFLEGVPEAISFFNLIFDKVFIITNQQGIGKGIMTIDDLFKVHDYLQTQLFISNAKIDKIYYCSDMAGSGSLYRKPEIGMALQAKNDYPTINFKKSIMVGDSISDMQFGRKAGMKTVLISENKIDADIDESLVDMRCCSLAEFAHLIKLSPL